MASGEAMGNHILQRIVARLAEAANSSTKSYEKGPCIKHTE
jgi:hypothetical protein